MKHTIIFLACLLIIQPSNAQEAKQHEIKIYDLEQVITDSLIMQKFMDESALLIYWGEKILADYEKRLDSWYLRQCYILDAINQDSIKAEFEALRKIAMEADKWETLLKAKTAYYLQITNSFTEEYKQNLALTFSSLNDGNSPILEKSSIAYYDLQTIKLIDLTPFLKEQFVMDKNQADWNQTLMKLYIKAYFELIKMKELS